jgi:DNA polymerase-3 subunit epsilon
MMRYSAENLLSSLLEAAPRPTSEAPRDARGLYGLIDHHGDLRYIGSTSSTKQTFYQRIHQRHRTGSEGMSHYFSQMYNTGRMWRNLNDPLTEIDGNISKALRNEFVIDHCRAIWLALPDTEDIARLETEVLSIAPDHAIAWNRRQMQPYEEPVDLVEFTLRRLGWTAQKLAAIERQRQRFLSSAGGVVTSPPPVPGAARHMCVTPFPKGPFRFFALDVETANNDRSSICQIGVACVRPNNSIETWVTYVDPQVDRWAFTYLHGISASTVQGAPTFGEVLPILRDALSGATVYQHSGFDRSAVAAGCKKCGLPVPTWDWRDSVHVARTAWPELQRNGGHGLANLKQHLGLLFEHHDAGEDARAAAEVVLHAEGNQAVRAQPKFQTDRMAIADDEDFDLIEDDCASVMSAPVKVIHKPQLTPIPALEASPSLQMASHIGTTEITQGNIDNSHIYLRKFFEKFPADAIGGSNIASAAMREISVDWGGEAVVMTDLDGAKRFFRKRGWIREFFDRNGARSGDMVTVEEVAPYSYRVAIQGRAS